MERMQAILDDLEAGGSDPRLHACFQARWHGHAGNRKPAREILERLDSGEITGPPTAAVPYPFPLEHWRMAYDLQRAVRLERARLLLTGETRAEGEALLRALAAELPDAPEPPSPRGARWRMLLLAKDYPLFLIREASAPPPAVGARGQRATVSWSAADPGHGSLPIKRDEYNGPLSIELEHAEGAGLPYISGRFELPAAGGTWTFSARVRATGTERILVKAYVWPDGDRAEIIATKTLDPTGDAWQEIELDLPVPPNEAATLVNVYAARTAHGTLWLDAPRLKPKR